MNPSSFNADDVVRFIRDLPESYIVIGGVVGTVFVIWWSEWVSVAAVNVVVKIFSWRGMSAQPSGTELAERMLQAAGEAGVRVDRTPLSSDFRRTFGEMDYSPSSGVLELTEDKGTSATIASAGLVTLEVGRALQYRRRSPLLFVQRILGPVANFAGHAWPWPAFAASFAPIWFGEAAGPIIPLLYNLTALMVVVLGVFVLVRIPLEFDATLRGVTVMRRAGVFSGGAAAAIEIFLGILFFMTLFTSLLLALNIFRPVFRPAAK